MIKINKQKTNSLKTEFIQKGNAVPLSILNDVSPTDHLDTSWSMELDGNLICHDEISTSFTGKWNPPVEQLSNVQGAIVINAEYDYAFPVDVVEFVNELNYDVSLETTSVLIERLIYANDKNFKELSNFISPNHISTIILNSTTHLSDNVILSAIVSCFSHPHFELVPDIDVEVLLRLVGNFDKIKNNKELISANSSEINEICLSANDILNISNWNFELSAYPTYRMILHPKYEKMVTVMLNVNDVDDANMLGGFSYDYHALNSGKKIPFCLINFKNGTLSNAIVVKESSIYGYDLDSDTQINFDLFGRYIADMQTFAEIGNNELKYPFAIYTPTDIGDVTNLLYSAPIYKIDLLSGQMNGNIYSWNDILNMRFEENTIITLPNRKFCGANIAIKYLIVDNNIQNVSEIELSNARQFSNTIVMKSCGQSEYNLGYYFNSDVYLRKEDIVFTNGVDDEYLDIKHIVYNGLYNGVWLDKLENEYYGMIEDPNDLEIIQGNNPVQLIVSSHPNTIVDINEILEDDSFSNTEILRSMFENEEPIELYLIYLRNNSNG